MSSEVSLTRKQQIILKCIAILFIFAGSMSITNSIVGLFFDSIRIDLLAPLYILIGRGILQKSKGWYKFGRILFILDRKSVV